MTLKGQDALRSSPNFGPIFAGLAELLAAVQALQADVGDPSAAGTSIDEILRTGYNSAGIAADQNGSVLEVLKFITNSLIPDIGGLVFFGTCDAGMAGSRNTIVSANLSGYNNDTFNDKYYLYVIRNANSAGNAPESERRMIRDYVSATGTFTTDPFDANVEANDIVMVLHEVLVNTEVSSRATMDMVSGELELQETNGDLLATAAAQVVWGEENPMGVLEPLVLLIDVDAMADGDRITITEEYREEKGEDYVQLDEIELEGADGGLEDSSKKVEINLMPNRHGYRVRLSQDLGTFRNFPWEVFRRA